MATKMFTKGSVEFAGQAIVLGQSYMIDGREGVPFMAWVRDGICGQINGQANTEIRVKWAVGSGYRLSDFNDVARFNRSRKVATFNTLATAA
jgi:hypothetical protein